MYVMFINVSISVILKNSFIWVKCPFNVLNFVMIGDTVTTWWSLYLCAKFGQNRCNSFDNMKLSIFCTFGLKTPIHTPKIGLFRDFTAKMESSINETPKRHTFARVRVVWAIKCEQSTVLTYGWVHEKRYKYINKKFRYILPICPEVPIDAFAPNLAQPQGPPT